MKWFLLHPDMMPDMLGFLPDFLSENDPRSAAEQIDANYSHGGGWQPFHGFTMDKGTKNLLYPGDPPVQKLAITTLRDELIIFYQYDWLAIIQVDGSWEVARID